MSMGKAITGWNTAIDPPPAPPAAGGGCCSGILYSYGILRRQVILRRHGIL